MAETLKLYDSLDAAVLNSIPLSGSAGEASGATSFTMWCDKAGSNGFVFTNCGLMVEIENPLEPGEWLTSNHPALDGYFVQVRWTGTANPSNVLGVEYHTTGWWAIGAGRHIPAGTLKSNTGRRGEVRLVVPLRDGLAAIANVNARLVPIWEGQRQGCPAALQGALGTGIITGTGDAQFSSWVVARRITASGSPDANVHASRGWWVDRGVDRRALAALNLACNQTSASGALTSGQAYKIVATQAFGSSSAPTLTKGNRAASASAVIPGVPAGHRLIAVIHVAYQAGGTSVISSANITQYAADGQFTPRVVSGRTIALGTGRALTAGGYLDDTAERQIPLAASSVTRAWLTGGGETQLVTTDDEPPSEGAIPITRATTDATSVTLLEDLRGDHFIEPGAVYLPLLIPGFEPRTGALRDRTKSGRAAPGSAASSVTITGLIPAGALVLGVAASVLVQPGGTATFDVGVSGDLTRFATALSSAAGTHSGGLQAGPAYYAAATDVVVTFDAATTDALGEIELEVLYFEWRSGSTLATRTAGIARQVVGFDFVLQRLVARLRGEAQGGATGTTILDVRINGTSVFTNGAGSSPESRIAIAAGSLSDLDAWPEVTTGLGTDFLELAVIQATKGGTPPQGLGVVAVLYPRPGGMA